MLEIGLAFARVSSSAFGGGQIGMIRREVVKRREWITGDEFIELFAIAQLLPGPNPVNLAVLIGQRVGNTPGAAVALVACTIPGFLILMAIAALYESDRHSGIMHAALRGCAAAAFGLTFANAVEMTLPHRRRAVELLIIIATGVSVARFHLSLELALAIFAPLGLAYAWWTRR